MTTKVPLLYMMVSTSDDQVLRSRHRGDSQHLPKLFIRMADQTGFCRRQRSFGNESGGLTLL
jgi:hypothetical protein